MPDRSRNFRSWRDVYAVPRRPKEMYPWGSTHRELLQRLLAYPRILEIGVGTGMLSALAGYAATLAVTIDNEPSVLAQAKRFHASVRSRVLHVRGDAFALPFQDGSFDAVFSQGVLEHWEDDDIVRSVREQLRVARCALVSVPSWFYPRIGPYGPGLIGNERWLTARRWKQVLSEFEVETKHYHDWKVLTVAGKTLPWPNQLLVSVERRSV